MKRNLLKANGARMFALIVIAAACCLTLTSARERASFISIRQTAQTAQTQLTPVAHKEFKTRKSEQRIQQKVLFEYHYINNAWGYRHHGFYVDNEGNVYSYDYDKSGERWRPQAKDDLTEQALLSKYAPAKKLIGTVTPKLLWEMFKLIDAASKGRYSNKRTTARDAGSAAYLAYSFDSNAMKYKPIELCVTGDITYRNTAGSAGVLCHWLSTVGATAPRMYHSINSYIADTEDQEKSDTETIKANQRWARLDPLNAGAYQSLGEAYSSANQYGKAIDSYRRALKIAPNSAVTYFAIGDVYYKSGKYKEAAQAYEQAFKLDHSMSATRGYKRLGETYARLRQYDEAIKNYARVVLIYPTAEAYFDLGVVYYDARRYREAIEAFQQALRRKPDYTDAKNKLVQAEAAASANKSQPR